MNDKKKLKDNDDKLSLYSSLFFKIMFNNAMATSILILDTDGVIIDFNEAFIKTFGYSKEDLIHKNYSILFIEKDINDAVPEKELSRTIRTGSSLDNNYIVHKNGSQLWVHGESIYTKDDKNRAFLIKLIQNITEQKILEHELKQRNSDLKKIINDRNNFIYTVSHDLISPINSIEGIVRYLETEISDSSESKFFIEKIYHLFENFRIKIRELSSIAREQETEKIQVEDINIDDLVEEILTDFKDDIENTKIEFIKDFKDAPFIKFSKKNLRSIITNLLSNAIKYRSPANDLIIRMATKKMEGAYILLTVQDNGLGIKKEDQEHIFEMYKRSHLHVEGLGMGMAIVKRILENEGGKIELESEPGKGTTFKVYFPI
ncbi:PAS/PAC sensor signal transduction histidine kinase [Sporocytophaga myxococcoides]|uniref:histidine kinase n=1 Tax=Sporocytophaga myxococcoides TaxID=153721 RepID=A0A098LHP4_9BACT|nr:PAS domain-containing sensor histidine kinase [Sporocytophaga myxococcoides]GAL85942.1 PAS/PAC sensor signal transduction histidine kinase [Sporocytophaga myxococcoides]